MAEGTNLERRDNNEKPQAATQVHEHQVTRPDRSTLDQNNEVHVDLHALNSASGETIGNKAGVSLLAGPNDPSSPATPNSSKDSWWKQRTLSIDTVSRVASTIAPNRTNTYDHLGRDPSKTSRPWLATWIRFGPLSGILCMLLAVASIVSSLGILAGSDNIPVTSWSSPPSTYLAVFTALANVSMRYAAIQGVVIAWWLRACNGTTLSRLHWDWRSGTTLRGALTAGRHMGLLGLACVFSTLVVSCRLSY